MQHVITDDLEALLATLPPDIHDAVNRLANRTELLEIVLDLGRSAEGRFPEGEVILSSQPVTYADLEYVVERIGDFGDDNRAGIERTLHRISAMRNRKGKIVGLTCRIGRAVLGSIALIRDIVEQGQSILILGRPGVGKTTLLRTVNHMVEPTRGEVLVKGPVFAANEAKSIRNLDLISLRRSMGYVIQETGLFPHFTVERNVGLVLEAEGRPRHDRIRRSHEILKAVDLDPATFAQRLPHQLSGGQRQRVGLARALAAEPKILLMDEPFGALDPLTRTEMQDMLRGLLNRLKMTVLLVTHDLDEALYLGERIVLLSEGKLVASLSPEEFMRSSQAEIAAYVRAYHRGEKSAESRQREGRV